MSRIRRPHHYHVREYTDTGWVIRVTTATEEAMFRGYVDLFVDGRLPVGLFEAVNCSKFVCAGGAN